MGVSVRIKDGSWYVFAQRRGYRKAIKCGTQQAANQVASRLRTRFAAGNFQPDTAPDSAQNLSTFTKTWLKDHAPAVIKASTLRSYESNLDTHILPALGDKPLTGLTRDACKAFVTILRQKGLAPKTRMNIVRCLSTILTEATEQGLIDVNPTFRMGRFCADPDAVKQEIRPLTRDECDRLLDVASASFPGYYTFFLTALRTGMRLGELIELKWADVDLSAGCLHVQRGRTARKVSSPKSKKARNVDLSPQLARELALARRLGPIPGILKEDSAHCFLTETGRPLDADNFRHRVFYPVLEKAKLTGDVRIHDLRHTYASHLVAAGTPLAYVKDQMGHSSIAVTVDIYGHLVPGAHRANVACLDSAEEGATV